MDCPVFLAISFSIISFLINKVPKKRNEQLIPQVNPESSATNQLYMAALLNEVQNNYMGTGVAQWLMCCAISRKFAGSIPDGVTGIFY